MGLLLLFFPLTRVPLLKFFRDFRLAIRLRLIFFCLLWFLDTFERQIRAVGWFLGLLVSVVTV